MTKSTITRERIELIANFHRAMTLPPSHDEIEELARMALAAMDSEPNRNPVLPYADSYRDMAKQGVELVPIWSVITDLERNIAPLYRHAQQPVGNEFIPKNLDRALGVLGMALPESKEEFNLQSERWIQRLIDRVIRYADEFKEQPAPVVPDGLLSMAASAIEDLLEHTDPNTSYYSGVWADVPGKLRAAMLQAGNCRENSNSSTNNCREIAETSTNRSREHFISLCNEFWNWSEMDLVCADDRGYELRMEWDGKVFNHPVTQALWRMYQAAPTGIPIISDRWIPVSERMPECGDYLVTDGSDFDVQTFDGEQFYPGFVWEDKITHWMPLPATPQEV